MDIADTTTARLATTAIDTALATRTPAAKTAGTIAKVVDAIDAQTAPVVAELTSGRLLPTGGEPASQRGALGQQTTSAAHQTVFGLRSSASADTITVGPTLPPGTLTANADGSITTPGGYIIFNDGNHQWRIQEPDGTQHKISGDPHVDENSDGTTDWHFNTDATFILGDGTKIFCDTSTVSTYGGEDVTTSDTLQIQYLDSLGTMDVAAGGPGTVGTGGLAYDQANADGQLFVLATDHRFLDGATLHDLFDTGGDFVVDVSRTDTGKISSLALVTLEKSLPARDLPPDTSQDDASAPTDRQKTTNKVIVTSTSFRSSES